MNQFAKQIVLRAAALATALALGACGGGGDSSPQQPTAQTINFTSPGDQALGIAPAALVATSTSGLTVSFATSTPGVCTVFGTALNLVGVGTCTLAASQAGNSTYAAAAPVSNSITVASGAQTISFISPGNQTLGTAPAALMATATSGLAVAFSSTTPGVCTVSGTALTLVSVGACTVGADQAGNASYNAAAPVFHSFNVAAALLAQTITFSSPGNQTLGTAPAALAATSTSGLVVSFASTTPGICTVSGSTLTLVAAGSCTVAASQAGNGIYAAATMVPQTFPVAPAAQTITFSAPANQTFGAAPIALVATSTSGLPVSFASSTPSVCTVSGTALALAGAGTCTVAASQAGNAAFAAATPVARTFTVAPGAQTITFTSPGGQTLGTTPAPLVATSTSGLAVSFAGTTPGVCAVSGTALTLVAVGTCSVSASQAGNANFVAATVVSNSFNVSVAPLTAQTITFTSPGNQTVGVPASLVATASSGLTVTFASTPQGVCTVSGTTVTLISAGNCSVTASQSGSSVYSAAMPVSNSFNVVAAPLIAQVITFASPGNQTVGVPASLVATASSGLTVAFASTTLGICTVSGTALTLVSTGTCTVSASQAGNATYAAATVVSNTFTVAAAPAAPIELLANGGFETVGVSTPADAWLSAAGGYTRSSDARTGAVSAQLMSPALSAAIMVQNSVEQGSRPPLVVGTSPVLTFWAKGTAGATGNVLFALRYLDGVGNIKANSQNQFFQASINVNTWTQITYNLGPVPAGAVAAFIEFAQNIGPIGTGPAGEDWFAGKVLIDDLSLRVVP